MEEYNFGKEAVSYNFNVGNDDTVNFVKGKFAEVINVLGFNPNGTPPQGSSYLESVLRTAALNAIIAASMATVKLVTWKK